MDNDTLEEIEITPRAIDIMNTTRFMGYTTEAAIADIIDNSISAKATMIEVSYNPESLSVKISDNGCGMTFDELKEALRYGRSPDAIREDNDLGRFGLGLKTASFSQCDVLVVISKKEGRINGLKWDPYYIETHDCGWKALKLRHDEIQQYLSNDIVGLSDSGTLVVWEKLSLMLAGESNPENALSLKMS
ncbi:MAG: ATP-binding protein, partial [Sphaerochaetaceae bacterium]|nr:ATP-binding protein [Sphaerochaetaceae bacterium]